MKNYDTDTNNPGGGGLSRASDPIRDCPTPNAMTDEIPMHNKWCRDCGMRKTVTKTGKRSFEVSCSCATISVEATFPVPNW